MSRAFRTAFFALILAIVTAPVHAQQLPKSGTFTVHSGWKQIGETTETADGRLYGAGMFWGITFNDKGSGPLHNGAAVCPYTLEIISGALTAQGQCTWSDADGDKIFVDYTGAVDAEGVFVGMNQLTGGTGKYTGIQGTAPFNCYTLNDKGQLRCTQEFRYRLP
ncbi:MAG: hypothetical protein JSW48_02240 [Betaproteobacteria bacterium]|nr:MAG: hypothetical protein JSW48_02240 [Betaproteobacteria bacterium]